MLLSMNFYVTNSSLELLGIRDLIVLKKGTFMKRILTLKVRSTIQKGYSFT